MNTFEIKAIVLDISPLDLIIGRATIKKLGLVHQVPSQFHNIGKVLITEGKTSEHGTTCSGCQPKEDLQTSGSVSKGSPLTSQLENPTVSQTSRILASLVLESKQLLRAPLYDDDDIDHDKTDSFEPWSSPTDILSLIHFSGDEDLQSRLRTLCAELSDIFSNNLPKEVVGQSAMQLTRCGTTRNFRKIRLQSSQLNCDYTLQVLQHVSKRCNQRLHCNDVCLCFYYPNNMQVQTATFQTNGLRSVRLYVHNT